MIELLLRPIPWERIRLQRLLCTAYCLGLAVARGPSHVRTSSYPESAFRPVGIVRWALSSPLGQGPLLLSECACVGLGALALAHSSRATGAALPLFAISLLWTSTYGQCFGMVLHTDNLAVIHLCLLALAQAMGWNAGSPQAPRTRDASAWPLLAMQWTTLASYFVAGVAKLRRTGLEWAFGSGLAEQLAYDTLRKLELGNRPNALAELLLAHAGLLPILAVLSLSLELGAPLCALSVRVARWWCGGVWMFHLGVVCVMAVAFPYPLTGVGLAPFFPIERVARQLLRKTA